MTSPASDLHVLLVVDSLDHGGAEAHVVELASALSRLGHRPEIACSTEGALALAARSDGIPVHSLMNGLVKRRVSLAYNHKLRAFMGARDPFDVVHAHMYSSFVAATYATRLTHIPLILTEHSEGKWKGIVARLLTRFASGAAVGVIAVSEGIRRRLVRKDHVNPEKVLVIMNALPQRRRTPRPPVEERHTELAGEPLIGVIGRLCPDKGIRHFIGAASMISRRLPRARFVVIGDGPERAELTKFAQRLGVAGDVTFLGYRDDVPTLLHRMDVLVVPSISEGTPLVVLEAMQAGVPVVASEVGGIPEQITHGRDGLLVPTGEPQAIANAVVRLHQTPGLSAALAHAAQRRVAEFDHNDMVARTEAVYFAAVRRGRPISTQKRAGIPTPAMRSDLTAAMEDR